MRLDKYLANVTDLSRTEAKQAIRQGDVLVDNRLIGDPAIHIAATAAVSLAGQPLRQPGQRYFMLHKPSGVVSATRDRQHTTVLDLLDEDNCDRLHIAGRLDIGTTGLVLLTDDGDWSHRITSPRSGCRKIYRVSLQEPLPEAVAGKFQRGIFLKDEQRRTLPAELVWLSQKEVLISIAEGKYHQVKRMFAAVGNHVLQLHRQQIGAIVLDPCLQPGEYRDLTAEEVAGL